ncbi:hypothetical protein ALP58_02437 [Pseudomonas savastanoi]|uniref:Phage head morphogenesis domain-containing protein n=2 Tax=Pseudomonas syringae group TaxID=136849 RepID=A0A0P9N5U1_PSESX|nr:Uncharacterized protein ALO79_04691 [Pseudomonas syringae pv. castaneae]KWS92151.1 hypothetical protein AL048_28005 [Pseudomonas syringae pv. castaneae]RMS88876.1 hypothetical protein ALP58_02437 [Pseudomonas savastanoi]
MKRELDLKTQVSDEELNAMRMRNLEADIAEYSRLGFEVLYMHLSGLSSVSRRSHVERSGELFTGQEMIDWWSREENSVACRCSFAAVMVDQDGKPRSELLVTRVRQARDKWLAG